MSEIVQQEKAYAALKPIDRVECAWEMSEMVPERKTYAVLKPTDCWTFSM